MTPDLVTVWTVRTDQPARITARLSRLLDKAETRRAATMPDPVQRSRFVVAHGALREIVGARIGAAAEAVSWCRGPNGKPHLDLSADVAGHDPAPIWFNLSNCGGIALVALSESRETGVDVERLPTDRIALRLSTRYFPEAEARYVADGQVSGSAADRFTTLWSRKEACVKARGGRLSQGMRLRVDVPTPFTVAYPGSVTQGAVAADTTQATDGFVRVHDLPAPAGHRAAVALTGSAPFDIRVREWPDAALAAQTRPMINEAESYV
jgi:4'-phosphopantetheinyl transferase